jgi:ketosteroid isomerase-like protein
MSGDPRTEIARLLELYNTGQADVMIEMYTENAVLHIAGNNPISGTFRGRAAIRDALNNMFQRLAPPATVRAEPPEAILTSDQHQMAFFRASGERHGTTMDITYVMALRVDPDGRFEELWFLGDDQAAYDRFWS